MKVRVISAAGAVLALTACGPSIDPCSQIPPPSAEAQAAARQGVEVESELEDGTECLVDPSTGRYVNQGRDE